jgi:hypothetical protein
LAEAGVVDFPNTAGIARAVGFSQVIPEPNYTWPPARGILGACNQYNIHWWGGAAKSLLLVTRPPIRELATLPLAEHIPELASRFII